MEDVLRLLLLELSFPRGGWWWRIRFRAFRRAFSAPPMNAGLGDMKSSSILYHLVGE